MPIEKNIQSIFEQQQFEQKQGPAIALSKRRLNIKKLLNAMFDYRNAIHQALADDLHKSPEETSLTETYVIIKEARHALSHLKAWTRPHRVKTPLSLLGSRSYIYPEPKGLVCILSPWNFPLNLSFGPLVSAMAAGNRVIIKPSEHSPATSALMQKIINELYPPEEVALFQGDKKTSEYLLSLPFNHIFFTGSTAVGKSVMKAAAANLASVTLELGGKSPVIIDESANLKEAATRISWGKYINSGQACISPDYVFIHEDKKEKLISLLRKQVEHFYGQSQEKQIQSPDYCRIINKDHWQRANALIDDALNKGAKLEIGGSYKNDQGQGRTKNFIPPTILSNISPQSRILKEEIFAPILPILSFRSLEEPITFINQREKPLALYIYSKNRKNIKKIIQHTRAGGGCINDNLLHFMNTNLPFGGSNHSGNGKGHGYFGFQEFSNLRGILHQSFTWSTMMMFMPPYTQLKRKIIDLAIKVF